MGKEDKQKKGGAKKRTPLYKIEGETLVRLRKPCPKCGPGVFMAVHKNRVSCGKCGYTEMKSS